MDSGIFTSEELSKIPKDTLVQMYMRLSDSFNVIKDQNALIQKQNESLMKQIKDLQESIAVLTQNRFGRKSEKLSNIDENQISMDSDGNIILNEAENILEEGTPEEPEFKTVIKRIKPKGKRTKDLQNIDVKVEPAIELSTEELTKLFPRGYTRMQDDIYKDLEYIPARFLVHEHHIAVYAGNHGEGIVKANRPERLLTNSLLTPALAAGVINAKYVNAMPLNRLSEEFARNDVNISRQVMAGWMITLYQRYLKHVYESMKDKLLESSIIHGDETPFKVIHDGKENPNSKSWMWVYHTGKRYGSVPIYLYDYRPGRSSEFPKEFLQGYKGTLVTDGYQVYHKLANERPDELIVAGCWAHAKRKYAELVKSLPNGSATSVTAEEGVRKIAAIYHADNMFKKKSDKEILDNRKQSVQPMVDAYFEWVNKCLMMPIDKSGKLYTALKYSSNQEPYLRRFLENPKLPLDNNDAERSIRKFCVGKHNWYVIDSPNGAEASAALYSIAETAKANGLKTYNYFRYLLEQILNHLADVPSSYLGDLMPWSEKIPKDCRIKTE